MLESKDVRLSSLYDALELGLSTYHSNGTVLKIFTGMKRHQFTDDILEAIEALKGRLDGSQYGIVDICARIRNLRNSKGDILTANGGDV